MTSLRRDVAVTAVLAAVFISLGSLRTLLIKFSENEAGHYDYLPVSVNVCAEFLKLALCSGLALPVIVEEYKSGKGFLCATREDLVNIIKWAVPGLLYFVDNLIAFYTMEYFQPAMVVLLGNFYIITTSLLYRLILKRRFSRAQWTAIVILFFSIMLLSLQSDGSVSVDHHKSHHAIADRSLSNTAYDSNDNISDDKQNNNNNHNNNYSINIKNDSSCSHSPVINVSRKNHSVSHTSATDNWRRAVRFRFHEGHVLVLFQCLIASTANVYNEKIFKENGAFEESIYIQNSKLYAFGLAFNVLSLVLHGGYRERVVRCGLFSGHNYFSLGLIVVTALYGLTVALIFKFRDNMFHVLNTQVTTLLVISASIYYFGFKPRFEFFLAAPVVLASIYLFNITKARAESPEVAEELGRPRAIFRDEDRPLMVHVLDQNED